MILHLKDPKDSINNSGLINNFSQSISIHNQHTKKKVAFLYTNNEQAGEEIRYTIPFTIASK
jgi:hypothetical protein